MTNTATTLQIAGDPNKDPANPAFAGIHKTVSDMLDSGDITARKLSAEAGVNETALNQFLNKKTGSSNCFLFKTV